jgi:hypothetical protein
MRNIFFAVKVFLLVLGVAAFFVGVFLGEWGETMFNATLL